MATILQLLPDLDSGGVERGTLEIARELVRRGHRSLVMSNGGRLVAQLEREGSTHIQSPIGKKSPLTVWQVGKLRRLLRDESVDLVHARSRVPAWVSWLAWRSLPDAVRPRFVTTVHGLYSPGAYSRIMTRGEVVIAVSRTIEAYIRNNYPDVSMSKVKRIVRGVDPAEFPHDFQPTAEFRTTFAEQFPQTVGRKLLTLPGRITRLKGHADFVELMGRLKQRGIDVHGLIVGGEDPRKAQYGAEIRELIRAQGLENDITLTGHRSDIREVLSLSHASLSLSSKPESFGRTVLESLSLGVPVIGYAHGGVGEVLGDLFPPGAVPLGDLNRLTDAAAELLSGPRITVPEFSSYRLATMQDDEVSLYEDLIAERCMQCRAA